VVKKPARTVQEGTALGRRVGATAAVERLLTAYWTEPELKPSAFLALLSYRYLHPLPSELAKEIDGIADTYPEMVNALSEAGFYLRSPNRPRLNPIMKGRLTATCI
jgi:hypothetical protein